MGLTIEWACSMKTNGATERASRSIKVEALSSIEKVIASGAKDVEFDLASKGVKISFLWLSASDFTEPLTYSTSAKDAGASALEHPLVLVGKGAVKHLGDSAARLFIGNAGKRDVTVRIVVGREAKAERP